MNQLPPPPPLSLTGVVAQNFKTFEQAYKIYMIATGLDAKDKKVRANVLLHIIGTEAVKVYNGFTWLPARGENNETPAEDKEDPDIILNKFKEYCTPKQNITFERHLFNKRAQNIGETFDQFYSELSNLSQSCDFGTLSDQMIRDRIVVGISSAPLRERLLRQGEDLNLTKTVDICRAWEATSTQSVSFHPQASHAQVNALHHTPNSSRGQGHRGRGRGRGRGSTHRSGSHSHTSSQHSQSAKGSSCPWCGRETHDRKSCPAKDASCRFCHLKGHFQTVCRKKTGQQVNYLQDSAPAAPENPSSDFLGYITQDMGGIASETDIRDVKVKVNDTSLSFRADTGADVCVIDKQTYDHHFSDKLLRKSTTKLRGPDLKELKTCGYFNVEITHGSRSTTTSMYVLPHGAALLSREVCQKLGLVKLNIGNIEKDIAGLFPKLFQGLGKLKTEYDIKLDPEVTPYAVFAPRRVSLPLYSKVKTELDRLQKLGVIVPVKEPTPWCAPIVVVPKSSGDVRICVDLTKLNAAVRRERHILPSVDHILGQMAGASVFSKIDANSGFHQILLSKASQLLTTFITPFGRFAYQRLPFGICSGPELFQREMQQTLEGLDGVVCLMDDVVVYGRDQAEHDERLHATLTKLMDSGITLNTNKCVFNKSEIEFVGQVVGRKGITASSRKLSAILDLPPPQDIHELRRFMGMVNQLGKFAPNLSELTEPLRALLSIKCAWSWGAPQTKAFNAVKDLLTTSPVLALYDVNLPTKVTADSSSYGLGAVLTQQHQDGWRPVAYASRTLTPTEKHYAQIEKEALASTWACERFEDYILGLNFTLETDHKPLVPLLGQRDIELLPPRLQRLRLRLMRYSFQVVHVPGRELYTADALSRTPLSASDVSLEQEINIYVNSVMSNLPASDTRLEQIRLHQQEDETCRLLISYCLDGWPDRSQLHGIINQYWPFHSEITVVDGILLYGCRIIIPSSLRLEILDRLHEGHQGISKCRSRSQHSVWWPGLSRQISELIANCRTCCQYDKNHPEPLLPSQFPESPWIKVATDLFEYQGKDYLLVIDYYSRFIEIAKLTHDATSATVINHMKSIFARFGIPQLVVSDNGPQYSAHEFSMFAQSYGFTHVTSSPLHPSANGEAERAVRTVKELLRGATDPYAALLNYRATPLSNGHSPAELLMSRRIRTKVPMVSSAYKPKLLDTDKLQDQEQNYRLKQKTNFDRHHAARNLPTLQEGQEVYVPDRKQYGTVQDQHSERSYVVRTPTGTYRRNRTQLNRMPSVKPPEHTGTESPATSPPTPLPDPPELPVSPVSPPRPPSTAAGKPPVVTRSGRVVHTPKRFED